MIADLFTSGRQERDVKLDELILHQTGSAGFGSVNLRTVLSIPTARACLQLITAQLASLPLVLADRSPLPVWLQRPDPAITRFDFMQQLYVSLIVYGNAYAYVMARDNTGAPAALRLLDPQEVDVFRDSDAAVDYMLHYRVRGSVVPVSEIMHVKATTLPGEDVGTGVIHDNARLFAVALAEEDYAANRFAQDGSGAAIPDGIIKTKQPLTDDLAKHIRKLWALQHAGVRRGPAILDSEAEYQPLSMNAEQLELVASRQWTAQQICTEFQVASHLVGVPSQTTLTYYNVGQDWANLVRHTLRQWGTRAEEALSLLKQDDPPVEIDYNDLLRPSLLERIDLYSKQIQSGILTVEEVRAMEGYE